MRSRGRRIALARIEALVDYTKDLHGDVTRAYTKDFYRDLARAYAALGDADALARIEALVDDDTNDLYGDLARAYAALGDSESTLRFQRTKPSEGSRIDSAAEQAARALVAAGALDPARPIADVTVGAAAKAAVLAMVARALLDTGDEPEQSAWPAPRSTRPSRSATMAALPPPWRRSPPPAQG